MYRPRKTLVLLCVIAITFTLQGGEPRPPLDLKPRTVTFSADELPLDRVLAELQKQTGNAVIDRRESRSNPTIKLPARSGNFWPTLDAIGTQTKIGFTAYSKDGIVLHDTPYRKLSMNHSGIFRFAVKNIQVTSDFETETQDCSITLETAWEPRFKVLYINVEKPNSQTATRPEAGVSAAQLVVEMKAPKRNVQKIDSLPGSIRAIGVAASAEFAFPKLKPGDAGLRSAEKDGVKAGVTDVKLNKPGTRWSLDLQTEFPDGAIADMDSYQQPALRPHQRVWLSWGRNPKTNKPFELDSSGESAQPSVVGTKRTYHFTKQDETPVPSANDDVTLRYVTYSRVVALTVPFAFRDLPLP